MIEALVAGMAKDGCGQSTPHLIEALTGPFDEHHAELARMVLDQVDALSANIDDLTARIAEHIDNIPRPQHPNR